MTPVWKNTIKKILAGVLLAGSLAGCGSAGLPTQPYIPQVDTVQVVRAGIGGTTRFLAHNIYYRLDKNVTIYMKDFNADILLKDPSLPYIPANKNDYSLLVHHAEVYKDAASLAACMNTYVFNDSSAPLRNLKISFVNGQLKMDGEMHKGLWVGFSMTGTISATPDGKMLLHPTQVSSLGLPVQGLMDLIGLKMSSLLTTETGKGISLQGNDIIMDPAQIFPPPRLIGKVVSVDVVNNKLHIIFDDGRAQPWPTDLAVQAPSCLCMWGGAVLIDQTMVLNAKIELLNANAQSPLIFAIDFYREQLEAGYVVTTKDGHMTAYVPSVTAFTPNLGRYAPPDMPIPGMHDLPTDLPPSATTI
jgi:hypothetical protein